MRIEDFNTLHTVFSIPFFSLSKIILVLSDFDKSFVNFAITLSIILSSIEFDLRFDDDFITFSIFHLRRSANFSFYLFTSSPFVSKRPQSDNCRYSRSS